MRTLIVLFVLIVCTTAFISAAEGGKKLDSQGLWDRYRSVLFEFLRSGDSKALPGLQLVTSPYTAEWDDNPEAFNLITDSIPKWGISWEMGTKSFRREYKNFLLNLKMPASTTDPALQKKIRDAEDRYFDLEMKIEDLEFSVADRYEQSRFASKRYTMEQYFARHPTLRRLKQDLLVLRADIEVQRIPGWGNWFMAKTALGKLLNVPETERNFIAFGSVRRFREEAMNDATNAFEVKVMERTHITEKRTYTQSIGFGLQATFAETVTVGINGAINKQEMNFKTNTDELQILIGAGGWKAIPVQPARTWYEPEVFQKYRNSATREKTNMFGKKNDRKSLATANIPHYPKTIFLAVKPRVEMFVSKEDSEQVQKSKDFSLSANVDFGVGSFNFDFKKGDTFERTEENSKLYKITMQGNSPTPVLMAIDNHVLAN